MMRNELTQSFCGCQTNAGGKLASRALPRNQGARCQHARRHDEFEAVFDFERKNSSCRGVDQSLIGQWDGRTWDVVQRFERKSLGSSERSEIGLLADDIGGNQRAIGAYANLRRA